MCKLPPVIASAMNEANLELTADRTAALTAGASWLAATAEASGLSQYRAADDALIRAIGPALAYFQLADPVTTGLAADLGAGNGALGATIALFAPDLEVDLVDRATRAYTVAELLVTRYGVPNAHAIQVDIGELKPQYNVVLFRALAPAPAALELALSCSAPNALICAYHHPEDSGFERPVGNLEVQERVQTTVPGLVLTCYRK